jgi:SET family sugar efflux transporter-like MFS transporter
MLMLVVGQVFRGVGIAIVAGAGIRYFQDLLAPATGRATTLFANACTAGLMVSGILSGTAVEHFGYPTTLLLCGVAAALGGIAFALGSRRDPAIATTCPSLALARESRHERGLRSRLGGELAVSRAESPAAVSDRAAVVRRQE